ncbi:hypothetical protein [Flavobacterium sp.]|uniref:hypothetical protein n=1 Tax=Flavobacterium sp. TaxID=239 RepID=UPI0025E28C30|nr:hypothetical protein [Flavobacterium sp.]
MFNYSSIFAFGKDKPVQPERITFFSNTVFPAQAGIHKDPKCLKLFIKGKNRNDNTNYN